MQNYPLLKGMQDQPLQVLHAVGLAFGRRTRCHRVLCILRGRMTIPKGVGTATKSLYTRLRAHFQFQNQLMLFPIGHRQKYSINIYGSRLYDRQL